jgi:curved DNA-binding protein CbpA
MGPNYFELLDQPRRPWLNPDELKTKFLSLSGSCHPDRLHDASAAEKQSATDRYAALNAAYNALREPKDRLAHLLELELGSKPGDVQKIPNATVDLFMQVGNTLREVDAFLSQRAQITSPLIKAQSFEKAMDYTDQLNALQQRLNQTRDEFHRELQQMNQAWEAAPKYGTERLAALPLTRLEEMYRSLSFLTRWTNQVQQRIIHLSL